MRIEFENGSVIECPGRNQPKEWRVVRGMQSKNPIFIIGDEELKKKDELIKLLDDNGYVQAEIPADNELLDAVVGYNHDPETHNYNRAERRRIIKAAKKLERKYGKKGR